VHFAIECDNQVCRLLDLGSRHGTFLNDERLETPALLRDGDEIRAGLTTFRVRVKPNLPSPEDLGQAPPDSPPSPNAPRGQALASRPPLPPPPAASRERTEPVRRAPDGPLDDAQSPRPGPTHSDRFDLATMLWEDLKADPRFSVIIKCTYQISKDGRAVQIADEQLPIFRGDVPAGDDPTGPVRFESDMVPFKPRADVVLVGKAYFPRGRPPEKPLDVTLRVGSRQKTIRVFGDRTWWFPTTLSLIPEISKPAPFRTMELVYERAFGGIDGPAALYCAENPVGRGFIGRKSRDSIHEKRLPNLEDPHHLIRSWDDRPKPVGLGFYGRGWMPRLKLAGTPHHPPSPQERARGLAPDFNYAFFNGAHPDLQVKGYLKGNEEVELTNLSPDGYINFRLPEIRPVVTVTRWTVPPLEWIDRQLEEGRVIKSIEDVPTVDDPVRMVIDTLVLIPDQRIFYLVFRGNCKLASLETPEVARVNVVMQERVKDSMHSRVSRTRRRR
jgi:hypothetical protein